MFFSLIPYRLTSFIAESPCIRIEYFEAIRCAYRKATAEFETTNANFHQKEESKDEIESRNKRRINYLVSWLKEAQRIG